MTAARRPLPPPKVRMSASRSVGRLESGTERSLTGCAASRDGGCGLGADDIEEWIGEGGAFRIGVAIGIFVLEPNEVAGNNGRALDPEELCCVLLLVIRYETGSEWRLSYRASGPAQIYPGLYTFLKIRVDPPLGRNRSEGRLRRQAVGICQDRDSCYRTGA
jgi:hypothetical protein